MTEPLPGEPVALPPSAVGAIVTLIDWFRRELAMAWETRERLAAGKTAADRRAREEEQRADRAERRLAEIEPQLALAMFWGAEVTKPHPNTCPDCRGSGVVHMHTPGETWCPACDGEGVRTWCEGCGVGTDATKRDSEGVPLCDGCYQNLVDEARAAPAAEDERGSDAP
jgi:hypothetical protein